MHVYIYISVFEKDKIYKAREKEWGWIKEVRDSGEERGVGRVHKSGIIQTS